MASDQFLKPPKLLWNTIANTTTVFLLLQYYCYINYCNIIVSDMNFLYWYITTYVHTDKTNGQSVIGPLTNGVVVSLCFN